MDDWQEVVWPRYRRPRNPVLRIVTHPYQRKCGSQAVYVRGDGGLCLGLCVGVLARGADVEATMVGPPNCRFLGCMADADMRICSGGHDADGSRPVDAVAAQTSSQYCDMHTV